MDILNQALSCGILNIDSVRREIEDMKRQQILAEHPFNITQTQVKSNGKTYNRWITFVMAEGKRKQVKRKTKEELEEYLIQFYETEESNKIVTFKKSYEEWLSFKEQIVSDSTIYRYKTDYKRFFENTEFEAKDITLIQDIDIIVYLTNIAKTQQVYLRSFKTLCNYLKEIFEYAKSNRVINDNPYIYVKPKLKLISKYCTPAKHKSDNERTISVNDIHLLLLKFHQDYINKPWYITPYAVEFAILTGCRVGEIAALRWSDINNETITIRCSEKAHRIKGKGTTYTIESTKTGKERKIPVTEPLVSLLNRVLAAENNLNCKGEFVFSDTTGRIKAPDISNCIRKKCSQVGIDQKSIHSCRRTINSTLKNVGANTSIAASLLGHTTEVNDNYYTYDVSALDLKKKLLEQTNRILLG